MACRQTSNIHRQSGYGERREEEAREMASFTCRDSAVSEGTAHLLCLRWEAGEAGDLSISNNALMSLSYTEIIVAGGLRYTHAAEPGALKFYLY